MVVAIIGILASVILASLNSARNKATDGVIKATMGNARTQAALYYETQGNGSYDSMCSSGQPGGIYDMVLSASQKLNPTSVVGPFSTHVYTYNANGSSGSPYASVCHENDTSWAAITSLKNPTLPVGGPYTGGWCVDSTGASSLLLLETSSCLSVILNNLDFVDTLYILNS